MMKTFVLLVLLVAFKVHCYAIPIYSEKDTLGSYLDVASDMISKVKFTILNGSDFLKIRQQKAVDCADIFNMGYNKSGVYQVWPMNRLTERKYVYVYCDMDTKGGGWTVIQRRGDFKTPKDYFYRDWKSYKEGFGNIEEDFWLGNDNIYALTNQKLYSVRFDLKDVKGEKRHALYDMFWIDDENHNYALHISMYSGDAGDSMKIHDNETFSTFDQRTVLGKCAEKYKGGWWYYDCNHHTNLNGLYHKGVHGNTIDGISWYLWKGDHESLEWTEIKIRPKYFRATFSYGQYSNEREIIHV